MSPPNLCGFGIIHSEWFISEQEPPLQAFPQLNSFTLNVNILSLAWAICRTNHLEGLCKATIWLQIHSLAG